jgi:deazaflavin-dependent oxidoreductase (nitroreductase family)
MTTTPGLDSEQFLYLTTQGHKTGLLREIEIWFTHRGGHFFVIAEHASSNWLRNLQANPEVRVRVAEKTFAARARVLSPATDSELTQAVYELSRQKYGWGEGVVVELNAMT